MKKDIENIKTTFEDLVSIDGITYEEYAVKKANIYIDGDAITKKQWDILCDMKGDREMRYSDHVPQCIQNMKDHFEDMDA